ncbi:SMC-Scp complex subunit ScpB [Microbacterium gubbeenense]|uniref:SMC-Scp complex subunit ScpB n=1 Tax=Microbacterium gubbeenense TaxID=159896 RepID=UPI003F9C457F
MTTETSSLIPRLEALLIVADEPMSVTALAAGAGSPVKEVRAALAELRADYDGESGGPERGFQLREVAGGWRIYVREELDGVITDFVGNQAPARLSQAALETLAVIAYKQPVTRSQMAQIRAVNVDGVVRTLLGRGLITEMHADPETGAMHYGTTSLLLEKLGINSIDELPHISPLLDDGSDGFAGLEGI